MTVVGGSDTDLSNTTAILAAIMNAIDNSTVLVIVGDIPPNAGHAVGNIANSVQDVPLIIYKANSSFSTVNQVTQPVLQPYDVISNAG